MHLVNRLLTIQLPTGTDHPFFPPLNQEDDQWLSVTLNSKAVKSALGEDPKTVEAIMGGNAMRVLRLNE